jgi:beta-phosphoglucomutase
MIETVIFDFDGVIVDSERLHWAAFNKVINEPVSWEKYIQTLIGFDDRDAFKYLFPGIGKEALDELIVKKAAAFQALLADGGAAALPGAVELIKHLSGKIPIAICSGALLEDILPIIGKLGVADAFDTIVTAEDTHISKPDPAPYSKAWKNLSEKFQTLETISSGLAIEDTPAGIASAKGAGLKVLAVTNSYDRDALTQADAIVDTLEELTLNQLNKILSI